MENLRFELGLFLLHLLKFRPTEITKKNENRQSLFGWRIVDIWSWFLSHFETYKDNMKVKT